MKTKQVTLRHASCSFNTLLTTTAGFSDIITQHYVVLHNVVNNILDGFYINILYYRILHYYILSFENCIILSCLTLF